MEIRQLTTFKAVSALLSLHRAAACLNCGRSSISGQIHALENELA